MSRAQRFVLAASVAALIAAPAGAQASAQTPSSPATPAVVSDPIDLFYVARNGAPIWLKDDAGRAAAHAFADVLRNAAFDGLADGPELAIKVEAAIAANDDKTVSAAWVRYVQALRGPVQGVSFGDPALEPKAPSPGAILAQAANAPSLSAHVQAVSSVNPLYALLRVEAAKAGGSPDPRVRSFFNREASGV